MQPVSGLQVLRRRAQCGRWWSEPDLAVDREPLVGSPVATTVRAGEQAGRGPCCGMWGKLFVCDRRMGKYQPGFSIMNMQVTGATGKLSGVWPPDLLPR